MGEIQTDPLARLHDPRNKPRLPVGAFSFPTLAYPYDVEQRSFILVI